MRKKFGHALRLGLGAHAVALVETSRWGREATVLAELALDAGHALPAALTGALADLFNAVQRDGWPLTVVLADELVRLWHVSPPPDCSRMSDLEAAAALRFQQLYGEPAADWQLSADWRADQPFLAAALPRQLLGAIAQSAGAHGMPLIEVAPQFLAQFNRWRARVSDGDWFGVAHDGVLTLGVCEGGAIVALRAVAIGAAPDAAWLSAHVAREALRLNLAAPERLRLCGALPPAWRAAPGCAVLGDAPAGWSPTALLALSGSAA